MTKVYFQKLTFHFLYLLFILVSCSKEDSIKRFKVSDLKPIDVSHEIIDFETEQLIPRPFLTIIGNYLVVKDASGLTNRFIHIFDKNTLKHLGSIGEIGEGPGEFMNSGEITIGHKPNEFWLPENSKMQVFKFDIDSALVNTDYKPSHSIPMKNDFFLNRFQFISDTLAIGAGLEVLSPNSFRIRLGIWDLENDSVSKFGYEHPNLVGERTNAFFSYSKKHQMLALAYTSHDIMSVFDMDGNIKFNIIGEKEFNNERRSIVFFTRIEIKSDQIITTYSGDERFVHKEGSAPRGKGATKLLFFDLQGNHNKVIETRHEIYHFAVDEDNKRIFCYFIDREIPIGYFQYD